MKAETKTALIAGAYNLGAVACLALMYWSYLALGSSRPNEFALVTGVLGALFGFLVSYGASVKSEAHLQRILAASFIREKEEEVKSVEGAKKLYEEELGNLKAIIEREGNLLLLRRLREVHLDELRTKLRELEAVDSELGLLEKTTSTKEISDVRQKLEGIFASVRNPEEDDRLIKQFCYSLPVFGNILYLLYMLGKKLDPTLQDRVHRKLNSLSARSRSSWFKIASAAAGIFIIFIVVVLILRTFVW